MVVIEFQKKHSGAAFRAFQWVVSKAEEDGVTPLVEREKETMLFTGAHAVKHLINFTVSGINAVVADHLEVLFRDMLHEEGDEFEDRDSPYDIGVILMTVIVKSHGVVDSVIFIDSFRGDDGPPQISADVLGKSFCIGESRFGKNIKAFVMDTVHASLDLFKRRTDLFFHQVEQDCTESIAKIGIVEMADMTPGTVIGNTAFGEETVDMGIPFKRPAEGMEDQDKTGRKVF